MLIRFERVIGQPASGAGSGAAPLGEADRVGWRLERYEPDPALHCIAWESCEAVCVSRTTIKGDRLTGLVKPLAAEPPRFGDLADLLDLVILFAPRREQVTVYASPSLHRYIYFSIADGALTFTDRLLRFPALGTRLQLNELAVPEFLSYRFVVPPATLLRGIHKVPPAHLMIVDLRGEQVIHLRSTLPDSWPRVSPDRALTDLDLILRAEMSTGSAQDRAGSVLLSGGVDSTLLASVLRAQAGDVQSYSTGFEAIDPGNREVEYARTAATAVGSQHRHDILTSRDFLDGVIDATAANEEPIHHLQSAALMHLFATVESEAGAGGTVYCGEAADGLFGNDTHDLIARRGWMIRPWGRAGVRQLRTWAKRRALIPPRLSYLGFDVDTEAESPDHLFWSMGRYVPWERILPVWACRPEDLFSGRRELVRTLPSAGLLDRISLVSFLTEGFATMAIWARIAEARRLQMSYPFASPGCLGLALGMPWSYKLSSRKAPVNDLLASYGVPPAIRERPKLSFGFRSACWAPRGAVLQPLLDTVCTSYDPAMLGRLQEGDGTATMLLWNIVALELWSRLILDGLSAGEIKDRWREAQPHAGRAAGSTP